MRSDDTTPDERALRAVWSVWRGKSPGECEPGRWKAWAHPQGVFLERLPRPAITAANDNPSMPPFVA